MARRRKRIFISFDFDNDRRLKDFLVGQSKNPDSPFEIEDWSMKEAAPESDWEGQARARIARSDLVIVMVGPKTYRAQGVVKEVKMARELGKPIMQIIGYRDGNYVPVRDAGRLYRWSWEILKRQIGA